MTSTTFATPRVSASAPTNTGVDGAEIVSAADLYLRGLARLSGVARSLAIADLREAIRLDPRLAGACHGWAAAGEAGAGRCASP